MTESDKMQMTAIGLIPEGWSARPLGELCQIHGRIGFRGYTKADLVRKGEGAITFSPSDIYDQIISYKDCDYISWDKYYESPEIQVQNGDILFCKTASIGKCAQVLNLREKATINPQFVLLNNFKCNGSLLYYMLAFSSFQNRILVITGGSTIPTISQEAMKNQLIPIPNDPEEQNRIANTLRSIDRMIAGLDEAIEKKHQIKEGLMQSLLTGRKCLSGSVEWKESTLGQLADICKGVQFDSDLFTDGGKYPMLNGGITPSGYSEYYNTEAETITISEGGNSCGYVNYMTERFWCGGHCYSLKVHSSVDKLFLYQLLKFNEKAIMAIRVGSGLPNVQGKALSEFPLKYPVSIKNQRAISEILNKADQEILALESQRDKYALIKQGMMQELLTGKTRLI